MSEQEDVLGRIRETLKEEGREAAIEAIEAALKDYPEDGLLWLEAADLHLPPRSRGRPIDPDLSQCANAVRCLRSAVSFNPDLDEAWALGGLILVDHLGMMEDALEWWEEYRVLKPESPAPMIEQVAILARYGEYAAASKIMDSIENLDQSTLTKSQKRRTADVGRSLKDALGLRQKDVFRPQDPNHPRWEKIERYRNQKPVSQTYFLFFMIAPLVFVLGFIASAALAPYGAKGQVATFLIILTAFFTMTRVSEPLFRWMNRNATDLDRALDIEMASGKVCIPENIREGRLHKSMLKYRPPAWIERHSRIVAEGQRVQRRWTTGFTSK